jgi:hypothetical protein
MTFTPSFGIQNLTTFNYGSAASDPDGDTVTYSWNLSGNSATGASGTIAFANGVNGTATLTISDGKGGVATDSRTFVVGTVTGTWSGTLIGFPITAVLTQAPGGVLSGTWSQPANATSGVLDPAATNNRIDANANVTMRFKVTAGGRFNDFTFTGTMDSTGTRLTGSLNGSGFTGTPFTLTK